LIDYLKNLHKEQLIDIEVAGLGTNPE